MLALVQIDAGDLAEKKQGPWPWRAYVLVYCFMFIIALSHSNGSIAIWPALGPDVDSVWPVPRNSRIHTLRRFRDFSCPYRFCRSLPVTSGNLTQPAHFP